MSIEMEQFKKEWSTELDDLEIRSAVLLVCFCSKEDLSVHLINPVINYISVL